MGFEIFSRTVLLSKKVSKKKKIAIVGMACRFPGEANSPEAYWDVLKNGKDVVSEISTDRWGTDFYKHPDKKEPGKSYTFSAGVLPQVDEFDADFFGISPREAAQMDPQQRLLLELTWEALENGEQIPDSLAGSQCAVYVGIASTDYAHRRMDDLCSLDPYSMTGNTASIASNRISYVYDLHGPSVSVDTACSSSLVALHQACNAIWSGDAPMAITGGVNMLLHPFGFVGFSKASMLSPRGRCRAFDASGDGYVRAEGSAVLFLKPLEDAEADGDPIHAVIVDTGVNCDGRTNGITLPSSEGQASLLKHVYERANINLDDLTYLEAHGTGTAVGDPLEAAAFSKILAKPRKKPLLIGSAKTNLGHLETASGMAGLLKVIMSLKNKAIPPSLHFETPNPNIDFKGDNIEVVTKLTPIKSRKKPLLMGVNSFGFGGANAHVIVEEYKGSSASSISAKQASTKQKSEKSGFNKKTQSTQTPLFISANSTKALRAMAGQYRDLLQQNGFRYQDVAWSAFTKRQQLSHGFAVHADNYADVVERLHAFSQGETHTGVATATKVDNQSKTNAKLALVFSGNGSQWQGMGCELLKTEPLFKEAIEEVDQLFSAKAKDSFSLLDEFNAPVEESKLHLTEVAQPLLFALQVGLMRVLEAKGLQADAVVGHSVGEVAAAWAAGVLTLEDAVHVIYERSHAQGKTRGVGRMAAAAMSADKVAELIEEFELGSEISIAGINSPKSVTLSGSLDALQTLGDYFSSQSLFYRLLDLDYAFHSPAMNPVKDEIIESLGNLTLSKTSRTYYSTVTGKALQGKKLDATYWWDNIRKPVLFGSAVECLLEDDYQVFLEIGPHPVMRTYVTECAREKEITALAIPTIKRQGETLNAVLNSLYACVLTGCSLDIERAFPEKGEHIDLPRYPWQREKHWYSLTPEGHDLVNRHREHPLLGYRLKEFDALWENQLDPQILHYLSDHVVDGGAVMPAAAYIEMALAASSEWFSTDDNKNKDAKSGDKVPQWEIENIEIRAPIVLDHSKVIRFKLVPKDGSFIITSRDRLTDNPWTENVVGRLLGDINRSEPEAINTATIIKKADHTITSAGHYKLTEAVGLSYGPDFQGVEEVWVSSTGQLGALAKLTKPEQITAEYDQYHLHPAMLDAGFQVLVDIFSGDIEQGKQAALIPVQMGKLYYYHSMQDLSYLKVDIIKQSPQSVLADFYLLDDQGKVLAELKTCRFRGVQLTRSASTLPASYEFKALLMPHLLKGNASPMPEATALVVAARQFLSSKESELQRIRHYQEVLPLFDLIVSMFAWQAIRQLNPTGDEFTLKSLAEQAHIESSKLPLLSRLLSMLVEDDLASYEKGQWLLNVDSDLPAAEDIWLSVLGDSPAYLPELLLLGRCGKHLADVLQHKVTPESLLFSEKSSVQEHLSGASPSNHGMNVALQQTIKDIVADWPANKRLRILEIGGSDTEISQLILPLLPANQCDYVYSHLNDELLLKAGFDLETWHFVHSHNLDLSEFDFSHESVDKDALGDIELGSYDIVIAANTLYQSDDLQKAQRNIKQLLSPKGVLLLLERQADRFMDMTFGLQTDWWTHTTDTNNPVPLLMTANEWRSALKEVGFDVIEPLIEKKAAGDVGAFLIIASHKDEFVTLNSSAINLSEQTQTWMILKDQDDVSNTLAHELEAELKKAGHQIVMVESADKYQRLGPTRFSIDVQSSAENQAKRSANNANNTINKHQGFQHIIETLNKSDIHCDQIVHLMGLQWHDAVSHTLSTAELQSLQNLRCASTVDLIQALQTQDVDHLPQLNLVTSGGAVIADESSVFSFDNNPSQAPLWGLGRVVMNEHPDLNCQLIDLQGMFDAEASSQLLLNELLRSNAKTNEVDTKKPVENEVIVDENVRHVMRMETVTLQSKKSESRVNKSSKAPPFSLIFKTPGQLKNLHWQALPERFVQADEIEIRPHATGLNFRDVMYTMGLLSDEAVENGFAGPTLGMEVSGTIVKVGSAVSEFKEGDQVLGFAPACFSSRVITQTTAITHKPASWSFEEAATIPTTFFTVYYALKHLAQIQPGEKILIHGAAGGVGIAAIQYARYCGAEIFATAGTDEKRDFVRLLGADHVMDSRSLAFSDQIMEITNDEGIDIVLNSLAGEAITRNLSILKPFGRFLELGKRDFYENSKIGLRPFRNNISYFGIDADQLLIERADLANRLFKEMMELFNDGSLRPMPFRNFPASRIHDAFRYMQQSRQVGKVIVSFDDCNTADFIENIKPLHTQEEKLVCNPDGSYLVTGGLSGFGLRTATWLVENGARSLVLISRSAHVSDESKPIIEKLQEQGVQIFTRACDVSDKSALTRLISEIQNEIPPLKGLVHAAMVLEDGLIRNMSQSQLNKVMTPKINGAWNLHKVTKDIDLDFFVMYSSATTYVGNPGQANYVAANSYLESLAHYRKSAGLAASYVAWGAISDVGYLARNEETKEALQSRLGGNALNSEQALKLLEKVILSEKAGAAVIDLDWGVIQRVMPAAGSAKYEELQRMVKASDSDHFEDIQTLIANMNQAEVQDLVVDLLLDEIEQILRLPREKLDTEKSIFDLGMDSLMGMELVLAIEERFAVKLPVMALTEGANIVRIAERITAQLIPDDGSQTEIDENTQKAQSKEDDISIAAARHGHTKDVSQEDAETLSRSLIEDAMQASKD